VKRRVAPTVATPVSAERDDKTASLTIAPLDAARWPDLAALFGRNGANSGCWCMWWRVPAKEWGLGNDHNREAFHEIVEAGDPTGLLAYEGATAVGWCAVAPRSAYPRIIRSPQLKPTNLDESGVWCLNCFFIKRTHRRAGMAAELIDAAVAYAREHGATTLEAYPVDTGDQRKPSGDLFTGTVDLFTRAGFHEHAARGGKRLIMRRALGS
jgi:GNAT superfamily N-acetyltransferase